MVTRGVGEKGVVWEGGRKRGRKENTTRSTGAVRTSLTARRVSPAYPLRFNSIGHLHIRGGVPFLQKVSKLRRRSFPRGDTPAATCWNDDNISFAWLLASTTTLLIKHIYYLQDSACFPLLVCLSAPCREKFRSYSSDKIRNSAQINFFLSLFFFSYNWTSEVVRFSRSWTFEFQKLRIFEIWDFRTP